MTSPAVTAYLDIGTRKIACLIATERGDVLGGSLVASDGVSAGLVIEPRGAHGAVAKAVVDAERMAGISASAAVVAVHGGAVSLQTLSAEMTLDPPIVTGAALASLKASLAEHVARKGRRVLYARAPAFRLDGTPKVDPIDRFGRQLELTQVVVTADVDPVQRLIAAVEATGLPVSGLIPAGIASAVAVTTAEERALDVAVVDIGAALTTVTTFAGGRLSLLTGIAIGTLQIAADGDVTMQGRPGANHDNASLAHVDVADFSRRNGPHAEQPERIGAPDALTAWASAPRPRPLELLLRLVADRLDAPAAGLTPQTHVVLTGGGSVVGGIREAAEQMWARSVRSSSGQSAGGANGPEWSVVKGLMRLDPRSAGVSFASATGAERRVG